MCLQSGRDDLHWLLLAPSGCDPLEWRASREPNSLRNVAIRFASMGMKKLVVLMVATLAACGSGQGGGPDGGGGGGGGDDEENSGDGPVILSLSSTVSRITEAETVTVV